MRTLNFVAVFVAVWVCVWTESYSQVTTDGQEIITLYKLYNIKYRHFYTTEKNAEVDDSERYMSVESLIDRIVDLAIQHIKDKTAGLVKLSDETLFIIPIKGEVILLNGLLSGVNTLSRSGKTTYVTKSGLIFVNLTITFDELDFIYDFQANIYNISTDGICRGGLTNLVANVGLQLEITKKEVRLTSLKLITVKTLKIQLDSNKFKDKLINYVLKTITSVFKTILMNQLEKELQMYLGSVIHF